MNKRCVFPGSFDPFTAGHRRLVELALERFDSVTVAVAETTYKPNTRSAEIRVKIAAESLADLPNVDVKYFMGMLTDFLAEENCFEVVRGIRNEADAEYERELERLYVSMDKRVRFTAIVSDRSDISAANLRRALACGENIENMVCPSAVAAVKKYYG